MSLNLPAPLSAAIKSAAQAFKLSPYALFQKTKTRRVIEARRQVFITMREQGRSYQWIGRWFGLNHATVWHHIHREPAVPEKLFHRVRAHYEPKPVAKELQCDRCGHRSTASEFIPEDFHHVCKSRSDCNARYEGYLAFCRKLGRDLRQRYIETA